MRKLFAILSLACLLFITGGYHLLFQLRISEAKEAMRKKLISGTAKEVTTFVLSADEIKSMDWENSSEFRFGEEMYDVLKIESKAGKTIISCISDKNETSLVDHYFKAQKQSSEKNNWDSLLKLLSIQFIPVATSLSMLSLPAQQRHFDQYLFFIPLSYLPLYTPPPKVC